MTAPIRLTAKQVEYLRACAEGPQSPWDAGAATVSSLRKISLIEARKVTLHGDAFTLNYITEAGRAWLAQEGK